MKENKIDMKKVGEGDENLKGFPKLRLEFRENY